MNIATNTYKRSLIFNNKLFTINGQPLYFSLEGFEAEEFVGITKIVEAFGGKLTRSDDPQSYVFVPRNTVTCSKKRYDIGFLENSIIFQKLQNLADYRLSTSMNREFKSYDVRREPMRIHHKEQRTVGIRDEPINRHGAPMQSKPLKQINETILHKLDHFKSYKRESTLYRRKSKYWKHGLVEHHKKELKLKSEDVEKSGRSGLFERSRKVFKTTHKSPKAFQNSNLDYAEPRECELEAKYNDAESSEAEYFQPRRGGVKSKYTEPGGSKLVYPERHQVELKSKYRDRELSKMSSSEPRKSEFKLKYRENSELNCFEHRKSESRAKYKNRDASKLDYHEHRKTETKYRDSEAPKLDHTERRKVETKSKYKDPKDSRINNSECNKGESKSKHRDSKELKDDICVPDKVEPSTKRSKYSRESSVENSDSSSSAPLSNDKKEKDKKLEKQSVSSAKKKHNYTTEEEQCILKHVIKARKMGVTTDAKIWKDILANGGVSEPKPTSKGLAKHFYIFLRRHGISNSQDWKALEKIASNISNEPMRNYSKKITKGCHRYTWDEDSRMIKFLIDNKAIPRGKFMGIWQEFLKKETLASPQPTAECLAKHFHRSLARKYKMYTNDQSAIKEFERWYGSSATTPCSPSIDKEPEKGNVSKKPKSPVDQCEQKKSPISQQESFHDESSSEENGISDDAEMLQTGGYQCTGETDVGEIEDNLTDCRPEITANINSPEYDDSSSREENENSTTKDDEGVKSKVESSFEKMYEILGNNVTLSEDSDSSSNFPDENPSGFNQQDDKQSKDALDFGESMGIGKNVSLSEDETSSEGQLSSKYEIEMKKSPSPLSTDNSSITHQLIENKTDDIDDNRELEMNEKHNKSKPEKVKKKDRKIIYAFLKKFSKKTHPSPDSRASPSQELDETPQVNNEHLQQLNNNKNEEIDDFEKIESVDAPADVDCPAEVSDNDLHHSADEVDQSLADKGSDAGSDPVPLPESESYHDNLMNQLPVMNSADAEEINQENTHPDEEARELNDFDSDEDVNSDSSSSPKRKRGGKYMSSWKKRKSSDDLKPFDSFGRESELK